MSARLGHVAIIDHNPRRGEKIEFSPAGARRYNERSAVERVNSHLHDEHGGWHVRVRGPVNVAAHLAFGLLVIAAEQMLKMLGLVERRAAGFPPAPGIELARVPNTVENPDISER